MQIGRITDETHAVYSEGAIVGSKLPNLKSPPPPQSSQQASGSDNCAQIGAIILAVVIAIVAIAATILTAGFLAPLAATAIGLSVGFATAAFTIAFTAVAGAVIGFAASAATQGFNILLGVQDEFDWKQVAIDTVAGFVGGAFGALGEIATTAVKAAQLGVTLTRVARVAIAVGEAAGEVGTEAASQAATNEGRIEQPWMFGAAIGGVVVGELLSKGVKLLAKRFGKAADDVAEAAADAATPSKRLTLQADGTVESTPVNKIAAKPKDVTTPVKAVDVQSSQAKPGGDTTLAIKDPGQVFQASGKKNAYKPTTWTDTAAAVLTSAQSGQKLAFAPKFNLLKQLNLLNVGQLFDFDSKTIGDFISGAAGKVKNNKVTIDALAGLGGVAPKKALTDAAQLQTVGKIAKATEAVADELATPDLAPITVDLDVYPDDPIAKLQRLVQTSGARPEDAPDVSGLTDYNEIPREYYMTKFLRESPLPKGVKNFVADNFVPDSVAQAKLKKQFLKVFENVDPASGDISRYEEYRNEIATAIYNFKHGEPFRDPGTKQILAQFPANPKLAKKLNSISTAELAAARGYTDALTNKNPLARYDPGTGEQYEDFKNINSFLRGNLKDLFDKPVTPAVAKQVGDTYDAYIRLASQTINSFEAFHGTTFRGVDLPETFFKDGGTHVEKPL